MKGAGNQETPVERRLSAARLELEKQCLQADQLEASQAKGSPYLYWLWRCHRLQREILQNKLRLEYADGQAVSAGQVESWLLRLVPQGFRRALTDKLSGAPDDSRETLEWSLKNGALLQEIAGLEKRCQSLAQQLAELDEQGCNHEAALSLLQFEEAVLSGSLRLNASQPGGMGFPALPGEVVALDSECRALRAALDELSQDARVIEAYVAEIEKIGADAPYSSELHELLARCQSLALKHSLAARNPEVVFKPL